ncbi:hypothetical protein ERX55_01530 [Macrococcus bovicus]|uniref:Phage conserved hypothetical protein C-terminal domain-containing protein n=2 Tax=Macrococcus bovicus TaxID=69968 RepID=A0A4R6C3A0_9STAP|nr:hypothetical protein ERX55_01530 [Macrococcus bovicus]
MSPLHLKVWLYILMKARHEADETKGFERGECLISIPEIQEVCSYKVGYRTEKPTKHQIDNILRWLRKTSEATNEYDVNTPMITTTKTTRGMVVKVHNYNVYQDPKNYEYDKESDNENTTNTKRLRQQPDTIHKNVKELKNDKEIKDIIEYLNSQTSKSFRHNTKKTQSLINARLNEGYSVDDFRTVIDNKTSQWLNDPSNNKYLRPETLFGNKFESYLNERLVPSTNQSSDNETFNITDLLSEEDDR